MRLDLECDVVFVVELHHARIVAKHADAPVVVRQFFANPLRGRENRFFEQVIEVPCAVFIGVSDPPRERLVAAMFAPRLRDRFQLDVRRLAPQIAIVMLDRLKFDERQAQRSLFA